MSSLQLSIPSRPRRVVGYTVMPLILSACLFIIASSAAAAIPPPPWGSRSPTSNLQVLNYVMGIMTNLPPETVEELKQAQQRKASAGELLSIVYNAKMNLSIYGKARTSPAPAHMSEQPQLPWLMDSVTNSAKRIAMLKRMYGDQWQILTGNTNTYAAHLSSVRATLKSAFMQLEDLEARIANPADQLSDLDRYTNVFKVDGSASSLFWHARKLTSTEGTVRTYNLFSFLVNSANHASFVRGSSYHFLGTILADNYNLYDQAFKCELMVHNFSACLVFTANAYMRAAMILEERYGQHENALALLAVDVPTPEYAEKCAIRHIHMARISNLLRDVTNVVRHLQAACASEATFTSMIPSWHKEYPYIESLWDVLITNRWTSADTDSTIKKGLLSHHMTPDDVLFLDALAHEWPDISEVPLSIVTNRLLANNIFPQRRRQIRGRIIHTATN